MIFVNLQENYFTLTAIRMDPDVSASNLGKLIITKKQENATNKSQGARVQPANTLHLMVPLA